MTIYEMVSNCFQSSPQGILQPYTDIMGMSSGGSSDGGVVNDGGEDIQLSSLFSSIDMLKEKVNQVQSLATLFVSSSCYQEQPTLASMGTVIQEIIVTASSMMFNCQQMALGSPDSNNEDNNNNNSSTNDNDNTNDHHRYQQQHIVIGDELSQLSMVGGEDGGNSSFLYGENFYNWHTDNTFCNNNNNYLSANADSCRTTTATTTTTNTIILERMTSKKQPRENMLTTYNNNNITLSADKSHLELGYDIVELDTADLLAMYTHFCQVCGKGFKRDTNLRMHMRAHGDEYKSSAALINPLKHVKCGDEKGDGSSTKPPRKFSCPQQGCRWNKNHANFQPLKSMICAKNHYKRSHCPKMYVCKRCNRKQFSILSDLRTHEKHCGDLKWQCSCGTIFSKKDKLMGHVNLFVGHTPIINPTFSSNKIDCQQGLQIQF